MSKIICDVCGTSYPESSVQCPICGCVRSAEVRPSCNTGESAVGSPNGEYVYIKGGRFSKSNVKKRNRGDTLRQNSLDKKRESTKKKHNNTALVIAIILLLLSILAVITYIYVRFFMPAGNVKEQNHNVPTVSETANDTASLTVTTTAPTIATTDATELRIPCTKMSLELSNVELDKMGAVRLLNVDVVPEDTTDELQFFSDNDSVVTINNDGRLQAVGPGRALITITCGDISVSCDVFCNFEVETTQSSTAPETEPEEIVPENFKLLKEDVTLSRKGETWLCYDEDSVGVKAKDVEWSSDNEKIATVSNGKVVAVSAGVTTIRAKYEGMEAKCVIRCAASVGEYVEPTEPEEGDSSEPTVDKTCTISSTDVTIKIGEQFDLVLRDSEGYPLDAQWQVSNDCCTVDGNIVTGAVVGIAEVYCVYNEVKYVCIVRVY